MFAGEDYYKLNRQMLKMVGLWPYQEPTLLQRAFVLSGFTSLVVLQCIPFLTGTCSIEYVVKQLFFILPSIICLSFYNLFYFNGSVIKQLFEELKEDWKVVGESNELRILEKYAMYSRLTTFILFCSAIFGTLIVTCVEVVPIVLHVLSPLNHSHPRKLLVDFELFNDIRHYFYIYVMLEIVATAVALFSLTATGAMLLAYLGHSCATYKIASTLIENVVSKNTIQVPAHQKIYLMYQKIHRAVDIYRKSARFTKVFTYTINKWFFIITIIGVLSLSCNLIRLLNAATLFKGASEIMICLTGIYLHIVLMLTSNLIGQFIINHSAEMFHAVYRTTWYVAPLSVQKLLLFVMQNSLKPDTLFIGGLFVASLEGFSTLLTTSISYFTVIYNVN